MTVTPTPAVAGAHARRRRLRRSGASVAVMVAIGAAFLLPGIGFADKGDKSTPKEETVSCEQLAADAEDAWTKVEELDREDFTPGDIGKAEYDAEYSKLNLEATEAQREATKCAEDEGSTTIPGTPTTVVTQPPSGDCYTTPVFAANGRTDNRFGDQPVTISGPQDVDKVVQAKVDGYCDDPFQVAKDSQNDYLGNPGINTEEVQDLANSYVADHAKWKHDAEVLIARLERATFELKYVKEHRYQTEEAIPSSDPARAPAAKDATSHGERWVLVTHMSAEDGGDTVEEVVICNFQKHVTLEAPPATTVPPPTTPPATTVPPVVTTTRPPTTTTTTRPPTTTTTQAKGPEPDPCVQYPTMPGC